MTYANLTPGKEYKLVDTLMDKETGEPAQSGGKPVISETTFTPEQADGVAVVTFEFDGTHLADHETVAFEELYCEGKKVAVHTDIEDEGQTVKLTPPQPEIGTTATDAADDDHEALADKEVVIDDEVRYKGLVPGKEYTMTGTLMDKQTGKAIQQDGKDLTSTVSFKPEKPEGGVRVTFKFDGSKLAGHTTVAFESLKADGIELAVHANIEDKDQTVKLVEPPKEQPKKPTPEKPQPTPELSKGRYTPKTGDALAPEVLAVIALAACLALGIALHARRRACRKATEGLLSDGEEKDEETPSYWRSLYQEK